MSEEIVREEQEVETPEEQPEEEVEIDLEDDDTDSDLAQALAEKEAKIKELEALIIKNKKASKPITQPNDDEFGSVKKTVQELKFAEQKRQFGYENNLSPEEADYIFKVNQKPSKELLDDPFIKGGLQAIRAAKKVSDNTPKSSSRSPKFELPKKESLTPDDKQKAFEDYLEKKRQERFNN